MSSRNLSRAALELALKPHGLRVRGGFVPVPDDALPALPGGAQPAVVWLVGQVGSECWTPFAASSFFNDGQPDPMDRWSKAIGSQLAIESGGVAYYPSDGPPYRPFQQWARRAEPLQTSPLMLQIHLEFGLWHAYRFALVLPELTDEDARAVGCAPDVGATDICLRCDGQPCLHACPVQAFTGTVYKVDTCATHLHRPEGQACMQTGCLSRRACPVGTGYRYVTEHAAFHMAAFARRH